MNEKDFQELTKGVREAGKVKRGEKRPSRTYNYSSLDVKKIRQDLKLSQRKFAELIHVEIATLQNWEQGRRRPRGPAQALLTIIKNDPKHAIEALNKAS